MNGEVRIKFDGLNAMLQLRIDQARRKLDKIDYTNQQRNERDRVFAALAEEIADEVRAFDRRQRLAAKPSKSALPMPTRGTVAYNP